MPLRPEEIDLLKSAGLSAEDVFDGRNHQRNQWPKLAKREGKEIVLGSPCKKGGHRLRTRYNHCIQCNPSALNFQVQTSAQGYVYLAGSMRTRSFKIGSSSDVNRREIYLNKQAYGGRSDWRIIYYISANQCGKAEAKAKKALKKFRDAGFHFNPSHAVWAQEVFKCLASTAVDAIKNVINDTDPVEWKSRSFDDYDSYEFREEDFDEDDLEDDSDD